MTAWAVVPAGGSGSRFSKNSDKLLTKLGGVPILVRTIIALADAKNIEGIILAVPNELLETYEELLSGVHKPLLWTEGGATRRESVMNALMALPEPVEIVAIHDAARPLIDPALVDASVEKIRNGSDGVVVAVPVTDTIKRVHENAITETVDRATLWRAQTPQTFSKKLILKAHQAVAADAVITDDAQLVELSGLFGVEILQGHVRNIKITTPEDITLAESWLSRSPV